LIGFAPLFEDLADPVEVGELAAHLIQLRRVEINLPVLAARVIDVENPLQMALARGACGTFDGGGMKSVALDEGAAQDVVEGRETGYPLADTESSWMRIERNRWPRSWTS
jgi:hypothetical protein